MTVRQGAGTAASPRWLLPFGVLTLLFLVVAQAIGLLTSPPDRDMGHLQKIAYVHVPTALIGFVAFFIVFAMSVLYLWKRDERHDLIAASAAEVGTVFTGLTLALGSIWGRPTWGVWWAWDLRLTLEAVLLLIFVSYLALRAFTEDDEKRARWSAAVGILGFMNVPIVYYSVDWWRTIHQVPSTPSTLDPEYLLGLRLNELAFLCLLIYFAGVRYYIARLERAADARLGERALMEG